MLLQVLSCISALLPLTDRSAVSAGHCSRLRFPGKGKWRISNVEGHCIAQGAVCVPHMWQTGRFPQIESWSMGNLWSYIHFCSWIAEVFLSVWMLLKRFLRVFPIHLCYNPQEDQKEEPGMYPTGLYLFQVCLNSFSSSFVSALRVM